MSVKIFKNSRKSGIPKNGKFHNSRNLIWLILTWTWLNFILLIPAWSSPSQWWSSHDVTWCQSTWLSNIDYIMWQTGNFSKISKMSGFCRDLPIIKTYVSLKMWIRLTKQCHLNICPTLSPILLLNILWQFNFLPNK